MRVLLSAYACRPGVGSEPGYGWNWTYELARAGVEVWVLTREDNRRFIEGALDESTADNVHFIYVEYARGVAFLAKLPVLRVLLHVDWQRSAWAVAKKLHEKHRFDIVHHVSYGSLHIGSELWRLGVPFIFGPVGGGQTVPEGFKRYFRGGWIAEWLRTILAKVLYRYILRAKSTVEGATVVLACNEDTMRAVATFAARDVRYMTDVGIPTGQIADRPKLRTFGNCELNIVWVGRLLPRKGILLALEALAKVPRSTKWRLSIIGDGPQARYIPGWVRQLEIEDNVKLHGWMPWAEVLAMYDTADLFLFTSLRDSTGVQLLEAMSRGVPILSLDHQGAATFVPASCGLKVPVTTPEATSSALARSIEALSADGSSLETMGIAGIEAAKKFTFRQKAIDMVALYQELLASRDACIARLPSDSVAC